MFVSDREETREVFSRFREAAASIATRGRTVTQRAGNFVRAAECGTGRPRLGRRELGAEREAKGGAHGTCAAALRRTARAGPWAAMADHAREHGSRYAEGADPVLDRDV